VLRGGENVEPLPLEMRMMESRFIAQAVVLGQDERYLAAMIVPSRDDVESYAKEKMIDILDFEKLLEHDEIQKLFETEIKELVNAKSGFKIFERISRFVLLKKPFEQGVELSAKQEVMRYKLPELYPKEMKLLFK
jgi:long-chain acyl-CoA synthetase